MKETKYIVEFQLKKLYLDDGIVIRTEKDIVSGNFTEEKVELIIRELEKVLDGEIDGKNL